MAYPFADMNLEDALHNVQTVTVPADGGGSSTSGSIEPGLYPFVSHAFAAVDQGQVGLLSVGNVKGRCPTRNGPHGHSKRARILGGETSPRRCPSVRECLMTVRPDAEGPDLAPAASAAPCGANSSLASERYLSCASVLSLERELTSAAPIAG